MDKFPEEYNIPFKLSRPAHELLQCIHGGQGDPVYALMSRAGDLKITMASEEELSRLEVVLQEMLEDKNLYDPDEEDISIAETLLALLECRNEDVNA
ncbi:MAG: hypothetical protein KAS32_19345 [Candidatus Peribacteraceae bacterium]|nr:hypothetical protein [Candidatus Peribacteraceae bacterium]